MAVSDTCKSSLIGCTSRASACLSTKAKVLAIIKIIAAYQALAGEGQAFPSVGCCSFISLSDPEKSELAAEPMVQSHRGSAAALRYRQ